MPGASSSARSRRSPRSTTAPAPSPKRYMDRQALSGRPSTITSPVNTWRSTNADVKFDATTAIVRKVPPSIIFRAVSIVYMAPPQPLSMTNAKASCRQPRR